jgi:hypothetical protein
MIGGLRKWIVGYRGVKVQPLSPSDEAKNNLVRAKETVAYVERFMTKGAGNKLSDAGKTWGGSWGCVFGARQVSDSLQHDTIIDYLRMTSEIFKATGCGNCGEQTSIAFMALYDSGIRPIDYMNVANGDHAFVMIGRNEGEAHDVAKWGTHAVVCDPWYGKAYFANEVFEMLGRSATFSLFHREV